MSANGKLTYPYNRQANKVRAEALPALAWKQDEKHYPATLDDARTLIAAFRAAGLGEIADGTRFNGERVAEAGTAKLTMAYDERALAIKKDKFPSLVWNRAEKHFPVTREQALAFHAAIAAHGGINHIANSMHLDGAKLAADLPVTNAISADKKLAVAKALDGIPKSRDPVTNKGGASQYDRPFIKRMIEVGAGMSDEDHKKSLVLVRKYSRQIGPALVKNAGVELKASASAAAPAASATASATAAADTSRTAHQKEDLAAAIKHVIDGKAANTGKGFHFTDAGKAKKLMELGGAMTDAEAQKAADLVRKYAGQVAPSLLAACGIEPKAAARAPAVSHAEATM